MGDTQQTPAKPARFCRIVELPQTQALLTIRWQPVEESYEVGVEMDFGGMLAKVSFGFEGDDDEAEGNARRCFEEMADEGVQALYDDLAAKMTGDGQDQG